MKIFNIRGLDSRELAIIQAIYTSQYDANPKGISWSDLLKSSRIMEKMARQTFSRRLKGLLDKGYVEKDRLMGQRGNPILYRLESNLYAELMEFRELSYPGYLKNEIERFEKDAESLETVRYIEAMIELALGRLYILPIALMFFNTEEARRIFYDENYHNIEQIYRYILNRASRSKEDQKETLNKLFEFLEPFSNRPIGKRFELNEIYKAKKEIIDNITKS